jgi:hypothetical protein
VYFSVSVGVLSDIMVIVLYFSGFVDVFSDIMVIYFVFFRVRRSVF